MLVPGRLLATLPLLMATACLGDDPGAMGDAAAPDLQIVDASPTPDTGPADADLADLSPDASTPDATETDAEPADVTDANEPDVDPFDADQPDATELDADEPDVDPFDADQPDATELDASSPDAAPADASPPDAGVVIPLTAEWSWGPVARSQGRGSSEVVWTGHEMMLTGGRGGGDSACAINTLFYAPALDAWRSLPINHYQQFFPLVFDGTYGYGLSGWDCGLTGGVQPTVTRIQPSGIAPPPPFPPGVPSPRSWHSAMWTGSEIFVWGGDIKAGSCGGPCGTEAERGARYNPSTGLWSIMSTVGAPLEGFATWTGESMFVWGDGEGGLYDPAGDAWLPVSVPSWVPEGSLRGMVWTGVEVFVYGEAGTSALYDPATDNWRLANTAGAPTVGAPARAFWTGNEVLVIGSSAGGHYDPAGDAWRLMPTDGAYFPSNAAMTAWTGTELISYGGPLSLAGGTPGRGAKYGPRIIEDPTCVDSSADLEIRITEPSTRVIVSGAFDVTATVTNTYPIQSVDWIWNGASLGALGITNGTINTGALPRGEYALQVRITDVLGNTSCHDRTLFIDARPTVNIEAPLAWRTVSGTLQARATCADDGPEGCTLVLRENGTPRAQSAYGAGELELSIDVTGRDGQEVTLTFEAIDARAQRTQASVTNVVVEAPALALHASPVGEVCDVALDRVLARRADDVLVSRTIPGGVDTPMPVTGTNLDCNKSRLAPGGALIITQNRGHHWNAGAVTTWVSAESHSAGDFATTATGNTITLRNLALGTSEVVTAAYGSPVHALAANGAVVYRDASDNFYRFLPSQGSTLVGNVPGPTQQYPMTNGDRVVLRRRISGPDYTLLHWDGATLATLVPTTDLWGNLGPEPVFDYSINGSFIAYAAPDLLGAYLLWRKDGNAAPQLVTLTGGATEMRGLLDDGRIVYVAGDRLRLWTPPNTSIDIGAASGRVLVRGNEIFVVYGYDVYRVTP